MHDTTRLNDLIDRFLEDRRESADGGWAAITSGDVEALRTIIRELIELKCDQDADGDYPIEFRLINRRIYERMHYMAVPYRRPLTDGGNSPDGVTPFMTLMSVLVTNASIAQDQLDTGFRTESLFG